jgi:hypothetical protein
MKTIKDDSVKFFIHDQDIYLTLDKAALQTCREGMVLSMQMMQGGVSKNLLIMRDQTFKKKYAARIAEAERQKKQEELMEDKKRDEDTREGSEGV